MDHRLVSLQGQSNAGAQHHGGREGGAFFSFFLCEAWDVFRLEQVVGRVEATPYPLLCRFCSA